MTVLGNSTAEPARGQRWENAQGLFGWLALILVLLSALPLGANRPVSWLALSTGALSLLSAQVLLDFLKPPRPVHTGAVLVPLVGWLLVLVWALIQVWPDAGSWAHPAWSLLSGSAAEQLALRTISADPSAGVLLIPRLAAYACFFWIAARAAESPRRAWRMLKLIAVFTYFLAAYGLVASGIGANPLLDWAEVPGNGTPSASFVNRNSFATYAAFGALANLACLLEAAGSEPRHNIRQDLRHAVERFVSGAWLYAAGLAICIVAMAGSQSRAGAAAGLLGTAVLLAAHCRSFFNMLAAALWAGLVAFALVAAGGGMGTRLLTSSVEEARFAVYPLVLQGALDRPWLGHGLGAFQDVFRAYVKPDLATGEWDMAHNSYLENAFELGIPASFVLYLSLVIILRKIFQGLKVRRQNRLLPCFGFACGTAAAFHSIFDFSLQVPAVASLFSVILGVAWAQSFQSGDAKSS